MGLFLEKNPCFLQKALCIALRPIRHPLYILGINDTSFLLHDQLGIGRSYIQSLQSHVMHAAGPCLLPEEKTSRNSEGLKLQIP